jgi:DNA-binding MarR family transcriptional regulator
MGRVKSVLRSDRLVSARAPLRVQHDVIAEGNEPGWLLERRRSLGRHLYTLYRIYDSRVLAGLHSAGFKDIRPVHTDIVRSLEVGGSRVTDVATRCNITKQAAGQVIKELASLGYVRQMTDRKDTRVRIVVFTERGMNLIVHLGGIFKRIDKKLADVIGKEELATFRLQVDQMIEKFD